MSTAFEDLNPAEEPVVYKYTIPVRFRNAGRPYSFGSFEPDYKKGEWVVVETAQGVEMGVCEGDALEIEKYSFPMPQKPVIRHAGEMDHQNYKNNEKYEKEAFDVCQKEIADLGLDMNLLSAKYTLDRAKILFVYLAEQRVDFRELLKRLGAQLHCRIELRQIGERDKAKMVGGIGMCGMECCCSRFKNHFDVISINMAKNQLLALNIEKLSGMCGKLMCCLKYEDQDYQEMIKDLPKMGSQVEYEGVIYRITSMNVMNNQAKLENRQAAVFLTLEDLKTKTISRKGAVMPKRPEDEENRPVQKKIIHLNDHHDSREQQRARLDYLRMPDEDKKNTAQRTQKPQEDKPRRNRDQERRASGNNNQNRRNQNQRRPQRPQPEKQEPVKRNITVRTFSRKKKEEEKA